MTISGRKKASASRHREFFVKIYEGWPAVRIGESAFDMLSERYQAEQREPDDKIAALKSAMESAGRSTKDAGKRVKPIWQHNDITKLNAVL